MWLKNKLWRKNTLKSVFNAFIAILLLYLVALPGCGNGKLSRINETINNMRDSQMTSEQITTLQPTTKDEKTEPPTEKQTEKHTEPPTKSKNSLESGMWVKYSPQAAIFETYEFSDGIIERKEYSFENGNIEEFNSNSTYKFMTYKADEDGVIIRDDSGKEWTYYFASNKNVLERTYQDTMGTDTFTVTENMYHHDSFPSYATVKEQSQKKG